QTHEHANRLHTILGLLALGEAREAERFVSQLVDRHHESYSSVANRIEHPVVAGLVMAEIGIAQQRGVALTLDPRSRLKHLPAGLGDAEVVTIVGNLLQNAFEAVERMRPNRRRVRLRITSDAKATTFVVRDWGEGMSMTSESLFDRGVTTKGDHSGVGLALVREAASSAQGSITARRHQQGSTFTVTIPTSGGDA